MTHFSYVFLLRILQQVAGFISFFFILRHVPQETIGHYHFVLSVVGLVSITSLPGIRTALLQAVARGQGGFFRVATRYNILGSCVGSIILFLIGGYYYFSAHDPVMVLAFVIAALLNPASRGLLVWKSSYAGAERFKALSVMDACGTLLTSTFLMVSVLFYTQTHIVLLAIALIIPAIQNLILTAREYRQFVGEPEGEDGLHAYGLKSSAYSILPIVAQEIDRISIYNFVSASELVLYNVAMKIPEAVKSVIQDMGNVVMPKFARMSSYTNVLDKRLGLFSLVILLLIVIFTFTVFPYIFRMVVTEEYYEALIYSQIFMCTIAINVHAILRARYILARNCIESFKKLTVMSTVAKIVSMPVLVFFFQLWGAVAAIIVQRIFNILCAEIIIRKHHQSP